MRRYGFVWVAAILLGAVLGQAPGAVRAQELLPPPDHGLKSAVFAGGCFWCMVHPFDALVGVVAVTSGYTGGTVVAPTYHQVSSGTTGHAEAVRVDYDPEKISFGTLLDVYWRNVDPFDAGGQFCDRGNQYRTAIFFTDDSQRALAEAGKQAVEKRFSRPVATGIVAVGPFYQAEAYHQNYYRENPLHYRFYRASCGRDRRLQDVWGAEAGGGH